MRHDTFQTHCMHIVHMRHDTFSNSLHAHRPYATRYMFKLIACTSAICDKIHLQTQYATRYIFKLIACTSSICDKIHFQTHCMHIGHMRQDTSSNSLHCSIACYEFQNVSCRTWTMWTTAMFAEINFSSFHKQICISDFISTRNLTTL